MSDLAKWNIRGPVKSLRKEFATWDMTLGDWKPSQQFTLTSFRLDGKISATDHHNPDGSIAHSRWLYDDAGRLTQSESSMDDGPVTRTLYSCDEAGRQLRIWSLDKDGVITELETCSYDADGIKTRVRFLGHHEGTTFTSIEGTDLGFTMADAAFSAATYDHNDLPIQVIFEDADHRPLRTINLRRDSAGRLLNAQLHSESDLHQFASRAAPEDQEQMMAMLKQALGETFSNTTYSYDSRGRVVERTYEMGNLGGDRTTYRYGEYSDPIEETTEHNTRQANLSESGTEFSLGSSHVQHNRLEYRYDSHGNWTERIVSIRLEPAEEFQLSNVEHRKISYHGE
jgi:YD repeat-containing protein